MRYVQDTSWIPHENLIDIRSDALGPLGTLATERTQEFQNSPVVSMRICNPTEKSTTYFGHSVGEYCIANEICNRINVSDI